MKPEFRQMSRHELKAYVLAHRSDTEAISALVEKLNTEANWVTCPPLSSPEDLDNYPEFLEKVRRDAQNDS